MSKLYNKYLELKSNEQNTIYLFKSGIFYIFLSEDAKFASSILNLKLTNFNDTVSKCGFPINSLSKYCSVLDDKNIKYQIIDNSTIVSKNDYLKDVNIQNCLLQIKNLDINKLTPIKAFEILSNLKSFLRELIL